MRPADPRYVRSPTHPKGRRRDGRGLRMIRVRRLTPALLDAWLVDQRVGGNHARYRLRLWRDHAAALPALRDEIRAYIDEAFEDARRRLRRGFEDQLLPFDDPQIDPAANYPSALHRVTLQGYFGETL